MCGLAFSISVPVPPWRCLCVKSRQLLQPGSSSGKACNDSVLSLHDIDISTPRHHKCNFVDASEAGNQRRFNYSVWETGAIATRYFTLLVACVKLSSHPSIRCSPRPRSSLHTTPKLATGIARKIEGWAEQSRRHAEARRPNEAGSIVV